MRKFLHFIMCLFFAFSAYAQKGKDPQMEYPHQKYLDKAELFQNIFCSVTKDISKNDTFSFKVDTIYYFGKCLPYVIKKNISYKFEFNFFYDNKNGDILPNKSVQIKDSFLFAIPVKIEDKNVHLKVKVTTVEKKMRGIFPFRKMKEKFYSEKVCDFTFSNSLDSRYITLPTKNFGCWMSLPVIEDSSIEQKKIMLIHGYDMNDLVKKVIPGVN